MKMMSLWILLLMFCVMTNTASAEDWGCYDPKPGHPTLEEKKTFVAELVPIAQAAERKFGVPAPAILAMASLKSGVWFYSDRTQWIESRDFNLYQYAVDPPSTSDQPSSDEHSNDLLKLVKSGFGLYMAQDCRPSQYPGWEHFPVQDCRYSVKDRKTGIVKSARVLMLNPTPEKATDWIRSACKASLSPGECHRQVVAQIKGQSGFQFPVAGVVYEDILPSDGEYEAYCFRNGVTVKVVGFNHRETKPLSQDNIDTCINGEVAEVMTYARIHGGTREDYTSTGGTEDVGTSAKGKRKAKWMDVVREAYQAAWESGSYSLLDAWVKVHQR